MNVSFKQVIRNFTVYSLLIFILSYLVQQFVKSLQISTAWYYILIFLYAVTALAFYFLIRYIHDKISLFANAFMLVNFGKLLLFTLVILVYSWFYRSDAISFTITFFIYYLLLTTYEIVVLLKLHRK